MLLVFALFWVVVIWGLIDSEVYAKEAVIYSAIWLACFLTFIFVPLGPWTYVATGVVVLLDIYLVMKVLGGNPTVS